MRSSCARMRLQQNGRKKLVGIARRRYEAKRKRGLLNDKMIAAMQTINKEFPTGAKVV